MKKTSKKYEQRRRKGTPIYAQALKWLAALGVVAVMVYGASQMTTGVAFDEDDLAVVNFGELEGPKKLTALQAANNARCTCGCGMTLAQCVATDATCPVRDTNVERIRTIVRSEVARP